MLFREPMTRNDGRASRPSAHFPFGNLRCARATRRLERFWIIANFVLRARPFGWSCRKLRDGDRYDSAEAQRWRARENEKRTRARADDGRAASRSSGIDPDCARDSGAEGEVAVSIFVNPFQFEPGSDFEKYPRPESRDEEFCREAGVDLLFRPRRTRCMLPIARSSSRRTRFREDALRRIAAGTFPRRLHCGGEVFQLLAPDAAVFGEKDFQQLAIIRRMVRDLNFPIEIIGVPTVRERTDWR